MSEASERVRADANEKERDQLRNRVFELENSLGVAKARAWAEHCAGLLRRLHKMLDTEGRYVGLEALEQEVETALRFYPEAPPAPDGITDYERGWRSAVRIAAELCDGEAARYNVESGRWERDAAKRCAREIRASLGPKAPVVTAVDRVRIENEAAARSTVPMVRDRCITCGKATPGTLNMFCLTCARRDTP